MSLTDEMLLVKKLQSLDVKCTSVFDGMTTFEVRREKVRAAVKVLPDVVYTVKAGKNVTLAQQFRRVYGCEL